jgi:hypothetical protein
MAGRVCDSANAVAVLAVAAGSILIVWSAVSYRDESRTVAACNSRLRDEQGLGGMGSGIYDSQTG